MAEIDDDSDPRRRTTKRTFNSSWDSDDELLQDDLQIKRNKGEQSDDELDEDALLRLSDSEDNAWNEQDDSPEYNKDKNAELHTDENGTDLIDEDLCNEAEELITGIGEYEGAEVYSNDSLNSSKDHIVPRQSVDNTFDSNVSELGPADVLDIDITNEIGDDFDEDLDATTESNFEGETEESYEETEQESIPTEENAQDSEDVSKDADGLNKVDVKEEEQSEDKVDEPIKNEPSESEEEEEDEQEESGRGRFKSERQPSVVSLASVRGKRDIPETLEISKEAKEKLDEFNRRKDEERQSKRNRRGGRGGRGGPQRYGHSQRGGYTPQGGNSQRGGFSQHGGPPHHGRPPQHKDTQYDRPGQRGGYQPQMRFSGPGQSGMRPLPGLMGNQHMRGQLPQQGVQHVPTGMNPTMFGQQEQMRPQFHQQQQRPLLMPRPQMPQQQPSRHQRPRMETSPQTVPQQPPISGLQETPESQQPKKIHINPHFKGAVPVSSHGPTWNNQNLPVSGAVTSSPAVPPRMPNQNRPPDQYNRQHVPPSSSWNQAPRLTPAQTWTTSQSGPHPYRDSQPPIATSQHFNPPSHRGPGPSPHMTQSQNSYPRMQQPQQMQPTIPNRQQQLRPRAAFPHQQPTYPPQQHPGNYSGPPVQNQHQQQRMPSQQGINQGLSRPRFPGTPQASQSQRGMNPGSARPKFPGTSQNQQGMNPGSARPMFTGGTSQSSQHYREPAPQLRQQTPRLRSPVNKSPGHSPSSPRHSTPQRTDQPPTPKELPQLPAHPKKLIEQASAKPTVKVKEDTNEDAETRRLRIQIEEQKKLREEIMKRKEERRQQLAAKRQEELKKRLAEQGHDVAKATKELGLQPSAEKPANKVNPAPESTQQLQGSARKTKEQLQEQFLKQKLNQQRQYHGKVQQHQPQPMPDGPVKVWKQQQNLKVLVDEPRPIPTVGCPEPMAAPQRPNTGSMNRAPNRGRGQGRGRGRQYHPYQDVGNPSHQNQNQQMYGQQIEAQHDPPQQAPTQQFENPVQQARGGVQGRGSVMGRGRGGHQNVGRGRAHQARRGNMQQQSVGRGQVPQPSMGRGMGRAPVQQAPPGNVHPQPAAVRKSVKERLGQLPGAPSPQHQNVHEVAGGNQQRVVVPPGQVVMPAGQVIQQIVQPLAHPRQVLQRPMQPNPMEGARLVKTEPILNRVLIEGLSASTGSQQIVQLTKSVGPLQNIHMIPNQRKAFLTFLNPQHAYLFQAKYNRHMLDLSMLNVKLIPAT